MPDVILTVIGVSVGVFVSRLVDRFLDRRFAKKNHHEVEFFPPLTEIAKKTNKPPIFAEPVEPRDVFKGSKSVEDFINNLK